MVLGKSFLMGAGLCGFVGAVALAAESDHKVLDDPRRSEFVAACSGDIKAYCTQATSRSERLTCVKTNVTNFSDACRKFFEINASVLQES
jgi:hypothetical protein